MKLDEYLNYNPQPATQGNDIIPSTNYWGDLANITLNTAISTPSRFVRSLLPGSQDPTITTPLEATFIEDRDRQAREATQRLIAAGHPIAPQVAQSIGYSIAPMAASLGAGSLASALIPGMTTAASILGGGLRGAKTATMLSKIVTPAAVLGGSYATTYGAMRDIRKSELFDYANKQMEDLRGTGLNNDEWEYLLDAGGYNAESSKFANYEAIPEAVGNLVSAGLFGMIPGTEWIGKGVKSAIGFPAKLAMKTKAGEGLFKAADSAISLIPQGGREFLGSLGAQQIEEQATELYTNYNQAKMDADLYGTEAPTISGTFKDQLAPVAISSLLMGGAFGAYGQGMNMMRTHEIRSELSKLQGEDRLKRIQQIVDNISTGLMSGGAKPEDLLKGRDIVGKEANPDIYNKIDEVVGAYNAIKKDTEGKVVPTDPNIPKFLLAKTIDTNSSIDSFVKTLGTKGGAEATANLIVEPEHPLYQKIVDKAKLADDTFIEGERVAKEAVAKAETDRIKSEELAKREAITQADAKVQEKRTKLKTDIITAIDGKTNESINRTAENGYDTPPEQLPPVFKRGKLERTETGLKKAEASIGILPSLRLAYRDGTLTDADLDELQAHAQTNGQTKLADSIGKIQRNRSIEDLKKNSIVAPSTGRWGGPVEFTNLNIPTSPGPEINDLNTIMSLQESGFSREQAANLITKPEQAAMFLAENGIAPEEIADMSDAEVLGAYANMTRRNVPELGNQTPIDNSDDLLQEQAKANLDNITTRVNTTPIKDIEAELDSQPNDIRLITYNLITGKTVDKASKTETKRAFKEYIRSNKNNKNSELLDSIVVQHKDNVDSGIVDDVANVVDTLSEEGRLGLYNAIQIANKKSTQSLRVGPKILKIELRKFLYKALPNETLANIKRSKGIVTQPELQSEPVATEQTTQNPVGDNLTPTEIATNKESLQVNPVGNNLEPTEAEQIVPQENQVEDVVAESVGESTPKVAQQTTPGVEGESINDKTRYSLEEFESYNPESDISSKLAPILEGNRISEIWALATLPRNPVEQGVTLEDVKLNFPKADYVGLSNDGYYYVKYGSHTIIIENVEHIDINTMQAQVSYDSDDIKGKVAMGVFTTQGKYRSQILIRRNQGTKNKAVWTLSHEAYHFWETIGAITDQDIEILNKTISARGNIPIETVTEEHRARYVQGRASGIIKPETIIEDRNIIQKIIDWIVDFINGTGQTYERTIDNVIKDIQTGNIYKGIGGDDTNQYKYSVANQDYGAWGEGNHNGRIDRNIAKYSLSETDNTNPTSEQVEEVVAMNNQAKRTSIEDQVKARIGAMADLFNKDYKRPDAESRSQWKAWLSSPAFWLDNTVIGHKLFSAASDKPLEQIDIASRTLGVNYQNTKDSTIDRLKDVQKKFKSVYEGMKANAIKVDQDKINKVYVFEIVGDTEPVPKELEGKIFTNRKGIDSAEKAMGKLKGLRIKHNFDMKLAIENGFTQQEAEAYQYLRTMLDDNLGQLMKFFDEIIASAGSTMDVKDFKIDVPTADGGFERKTITEIRNELNDLSDTFFPRVRDSGKYAVIARKLMTNPDGSLKLAQESIDEINKYRDAVIGAEGSKINKRSDNEKALINEIVRYRTQGKSSLVSEVFSSDKIAELASRFNLTEDNVATIADTITTFIRQGVINEKNPYRRHFSFEFQAKWDAAKMKREGYTESYYERMPQNVQSTSSAIGSTASLIGTMKTIMERLEAQHNSTIYDDLRSIPWLNVSEVTENTKETANRKSAPETRLVFTLKGDPNEIQANYQKMKIVMGLARIQLGRFENGKTVKKSIWPINTKNHQEGWKLANPEANTEATILAAINQVSGNTEAVFNDFILSSVEVMSDLMNAIGFRSTQISRSKDTGIDVWVGYETDPVKAVTETASRTGAGISKARMWGRILKILAGVDGVKPINNVMGEDEKIDPQLYIKRLAIEKREYVRKVKENALSATKEPQLYNESMTYVYHLLRQPDEFDHTMGIIKAAATFMFIGANVYSPIMNFSAALTSIPGATSAYAHMPIEQYPKAFAKAMGEYTNYLVAKNGLKPGQKLEIDSDWGRKNKDWVGLFETISLYGYDLAQFNQDALAVVRAQPSRWMNQIVDKSMWIFGQSEKALRATSIGLNYMYLKQLDKEGKLDISHFDAYPNKEQRQEYFDYYKNLKILEANRPGTITPELTESVRKSAKLFYRNRSKIKTPYGMSEAPKASIEVTGADQVLFDIAKKVSDIANGVYDKSDAPFVVQKFKSADMMLIFMKYPHTYFQSIARMAGMKDWKSVALMSMAPVFLAGAVGFPPYYILKPLIAPILNKLLGSDDIEADFYRKMEDISPALGTFTHDGMVGFSGITFRNSVGVQVPTLSSMVPMALYKKAQNAYGYFKEGEALRGLSEVTPKILSSPLRSYREYNEGLTTKKNTPIFYGDEKVKPSLYEAIMTTAGFSPTRIGRIKEEIFQDKKLVQYYVQKRADINAMYKGYMNEPAENRKRGDLETIMEAVVKYNNRVKSKEEAGLLPKGAIPLITIKSLNITVKKANKPSKFSMAKAREMREN